MKFTGIFLLCAVFAIAAVAGEDGAVETTDELGVFSIKSMLVDLRARVEKEPGKLYKEGLIKYRELVKMGVLQSNSMVDSFVESASEVEVDEESKKFALEYIDALLEFMATDSGVRLATTVDKILLSDNKSPDWLTYFMDIVERKDVINTLLSPISKLIFVGMDKARQFVKEDPNMFMVNLYLGSQGMSTIDDNDILMSLVSISEKMLELKAGEWSGQTKQFIRQFEKNYYKLADYDSTPREKLHEHMEKFMLDALADPVADLFQSTLYVRNDTRCAELLLCSFNEKYEKSGVKLKKVIAQNLSFAAAYGWMYMGQDIQAGDVERMMKAYMDGYTKGDCLRRHKDAPESCNILSPLQNEAIGKDEL